MLLPRVSWVREKVATQATYLLISEFLDSKKTVSPQDALNSSALPCKSFWLALGFGSAAVHSQSNSLWTAPSQPLYMILQIHLPALLKELLQQQSSSRPWCFSVAKWTNCLFIVCFLSYIEAIYFACHNFASISLPCEAFDQQALHGMC